MRVPTTTVLAWALWALLVALWAVSLSLMTVTEPDVIMEMLLFTPAFLGFPTVGALIASRRPENAVGWLFCLLPLLTSYGLFSQQYFLYAVVVQPGALPGPLVVAWFGKLLGSFGWASLLTLTLLLFPTGRLPSPRWRPLAWTVIALLAVNSLAEALAAGPIDEEGRAPDVLNPFALEPAADLVAVMDQTEWVFTLLTLGCVASVIVRFRQAGGVERQQLKWFAAAASMLIACFVLGSLLEETLRVIAGVLYAVGLAAVPAAAGVAILRHRLYDIDLIIHQALVYGSLTATLLAIYLGAVILLQSLFRQFTGPSELAIIASTLAIAALFQPLRRRIQTFIDRRFYRHKYDATRTLAAFSAHLRDEVDLPMLQRELLAVVRETMQPASVSLWVRPAVSAPRVAGQRAEDE